MGEEFYSAIKLITGEEIFSLVCIDENDGDPIIILQNPVVMKTFHHNGRSFMKVKPWMEIPDDDMFVIKMDRIITMTEIKSKSLITIYNNYIENYDDADGSYTGEYGEDGKVTISDKMGFISTVDDARKKLENLFNDNKDNKES